MKVYLLEPENHQLWDDYVSNNPVGTIFHTVKWLKEFSKDIQVYVCAEKGEIIGGVSLIKTTKIGKKGYHIPPFTPYFGPLLGTREEYLNEMCITKQNERFEKLLKVIPKSPHIDFRMPSEFSNVHAFVWDGFTPVANINYIIDGTIESYGYNINRNKARELLKLKELIARKEIIIYEGIDLEILQYLLYELKAIKKFNIRYNLLEKIITGELKDSFRMVSVRSDKLGWLSTVVTVSDYRRVYNLVNASKRVSHPNLKTANLLPLDNQIRYALSAGKIFDFEGSMIKGVEKFYRLLGGQPEPVLRLKKSSSIYFASLYTVKSWIQIRKVNSSKVENRD